jgi:spore germination cell wall hydrolase CwlJ-like protein
MHILRNALLALSLLALPAQADTTASPIDQALAVEQSRMALLNGDKLKGFLLFRKEPRKQPVERTRAWIDAQPFLEGDAQWACMTEALYFEARGESTEGQFAVAEVILNRAESREFPNTVCKVINQGTGRKHRCQFSYMCDGLAETMDDQRAYERMGKIAHIMLNGGPRDLTDGATYYHAKYVNPSWARAFTRTATVGKHHFYRTATRLTQK